MKKIFFLVSTVGLNLFFTSCAQNQYMLKREISSEPEKYILKSEDAVKRIKELKAAPLSDGECFADPDTKIYLSNVKESATGNYRDLKSQINVTKLENNGSTEYYFCRVTCLLNNRYAAFWTTLTDSPARHNDDNGFICQGVSMEMVNIPGTSLQTLGPIVKTVSAFDQSELLSKFKEINYKMPPETKAKLDEKAFRNFATVSKAYLSSTMPAMIEAGRILDQIATRKKGYNAVIDKYVALIKANNGKLPATISTDYFVIMNILQHGRHLLY